MAADEQAPGSGQPIQRGQSIQAMRKGGRTPALARAGQPLTEAEPVPVPGAAPRQLSAQAQQQGPVGRGRTIGTALAGTGLGKGLGAARRGGGNPTLGRFGRRGL